MAYRIDIILSNGNTAIAKPLSFDYVSFNRNTFLPDEKYVYSNVDVKEFIKVVKTVKNDTSISFIKCQIDDVETPQDAINIFGDGRQIICGNATFVKEAPKRKETVELKLCAFTNIFYSFKNKRITLTIEPCYTEYE